MFFDDADHGGFFMFAFRTAAMLKAYEKPPFTFEQQLERLSERGLSIDDWDYALYKLKTINYYRLSAYCRPFRVGNSPSSAPRRFVPGARFEEVIKLYEFDRRLRLMVMDAIERIEIHVRALMTYHLGHKYGTFGHADASNFHPKFDHSDWLQKIKDQARRSSDVFIAHYEGKYSGFPVLPIWMTAEVISLGSLSFAYKGLKSEDKKAIYGQLGLRDNRLGDWLHQLTYVRNVCAHHSRLWNRELSIHPRAVRDPVWKPPVTPRNDSVFFVLLVLRYLLRTMANGDQWREQAAGLIEPIAREERWRSAMGMPDSWREHPIWR